MGFLKEVVKSELLSMVSSYRGKLGHVLVRGAQGSEPQLLGELGERRVGEERNVAEQLVANVGLGRVGRDGRVADVLGRVEDPERQPGEEVAGREETRHRPEREPGAA